MRNPKRGAHRTGLFELKRPVGRENLLGLRKMYVTTKRPEKKKSVGEGSMSNYHLLQNSKHKEDAHQTGKNGSQSKPRDCRKQKRCATRIVNP